MKKGFTVIELLVVVAIIAILSSIVIISIDVYRTRSANTSIQAMLGQIRSESVLYHQTNGSFTDLCDASTPYQIVEQRSEACFQAGIVLNDPRCRCDDGIDSWVIAVPLRDSDLGDAWCVDSNNFGGGIDAIRFSAIGTGILCQ